MTGRHWWKRTPILRCDFLSRLVSVVALKAYEGKGMGQQKTSSAEAANIYFSHLKFNIPHCKFSYLSEEPGTDWARSSVHIHAQLF